MRGRYAVTVGPERCQQCEREHDLVVTTRYSGDEDEAPWTTKLCVDCINVDYTVVCGLGEEEPSPKKQPPLLRIQRIAGKIQNLILEISIAQARYSLDQEQAEADKAVRLQNNLHALMGELEAVYKPYRPVAVR